MKCQLDCFYRRHRPAAVALALGLAFAFRAAANPTGAVVTQGSASVKSQGSTLTVQTGGNTFINWSSFNIGAGETTTFLQPSSSSVVWNQINDPNPSQILGNLNANGYVVLQNQAGFYIGGQASIATHGLLLTTAPTPAPELFSGGAWQFNAPPPTASIINYGQINIAGGSSAYLIAHDILNNGSITAPGGSIGLYAGQQVLVSDRPDGRGLSATVTLPAGSVDNAGKLIADAGTIEMNAQVVNQGGLVQANSVRAVNGVIELLASDSLDLSASSVISAQGDRAGISPGGTVTIKAGNAFADQTGSVINISGGSQGGNGGSAEISAATLDSIQSGINGQAANGFTGGTLLIDPANITLTSANLGNYTGLSGINVVATGNITIGSSLTLAPSQTSETLSLSAGNDITLGSASTGYGVIAGTGWSLNLQAGTSLPLGSQPTPGNDSIVLNSTSYLQSQNGNITVFAPGSVTVNSGAIRTLAGGSIAVTAQYGNVNAGDNVNGFNFAPAISTRHNSAPYYTVSTALGGISTAAGGNVTITAGGNVTSYLPVETDYLNAVNDAGSGAFGPEPGNVTITAGGNVGGHYILANGVGSITADGNVGVPLGSAGTTGAFALSLINGNWNVFAPDGSIYVEDIRNPNGVFNDGGNPLVYKGYHLFDYSPTASVTLDAGNSVEITGDEAPHSNAQDGTTIENIFPPSLTVITGAGGFVLDTDVYLFPSPNGELNINTYNGGGFSSYISPTDPESNHKLVMSDSGATQWSPGIFDENNHAVVPPELNNPNPVLVNISGSIDNVELRTTKETQVNVGGDTLNFSLVAENLHPTDVSFVNVAGTISYSPVFTFTPPGPAIVSADPNLPSSWDSIFSLLVNPGEFSLQIQDPAAVLKMTPAQQTAYAFAHVVRLDLNPNHFTLLPGYDPSANPGFIYDAATGQLGYQFQMSSLVLQTLTQVNAAGVSAIPVLKLDALGHVQIVQNANGTYSFATTTVSFAPPSEIINLYALSQNSVANELAQQNSYGLEIGGPGKLNIAATSVELGSSSGIVSWGIGISDSGINYSYLDPYTATGAAVTVDATQDISLLTSTIASIYGGRLSVNSGGGIELSQGNFALIPPGGSYAYGIYTSGNSGVSVIANGNIEIGGARIGTFNGGNVFIESENGSVDAGNGANSLLLVPVIYKDPTTGLPVFSSIASPRPYGSGVLAVAPSALYQAPGLNSLPGNIVINTPQGDIVSTLGGIEQLALGATLGNGPSITLNAGTPPSGTSGTAGYTPGYPGNVSLGLGGVIGGTINITAQGNIQGLILSSQNANINAAQSFTGTLLAAGTANVSAGTGTVSGTIVGVGGANVSGGSGVSAQVLSQNASIGGASQTSTLGNSAAPTATAQNASASSSSDAKGQLASDNNGDDDLKKRGKLPVLTRRVSRVTVIIPKT